MLQDRLLRVRLPMSLNVEIGIILAAIASFGPGVKSASNGNEYKEFSWGGREQGARTANNHL
jgi:hypothetical protein